MSEEGEERMKGGRNTQDGGTIDISRFLIYNCG